MPNSTDKPTSLVAINLVGATAQPVTIEPVCWCVAASGYAASNASHMSKRGSSGRLSARGCGVLSPMSRVPHTSSSGIHHVCAV